MERQRPGFLATMLLLCVALVPLASGAQAGADPYAAAPGHRFPAQQVETTDTDPAAGNETTPGGTDGVILSVDVYENGSAAWHIEYRTRLDDRAGREAFKQLQRDLESGSAASSEGFYSRIKGTVGAAEETTGREMAATDFDVRTTVRRIPREYGVVVYSFQWNGFATRGDDGLRVGDALDGFFLSAGERLVVSWPEGYERAAVEPTPDAERERTVVWRGPTSFGSGGPELRLTEQAWAGPGLHSVAVAAGLVAFAAGIWTLRRRLDQPSIQLGAGLFDDETDDGDLLSNEERVVRLLRERGGRAKQQEVAEEFGWTEAKTSYVVSNLREEQWIRSFRIGRENVLSLADSLDGTQSEA
jgi:hypothetical protein